MPTIVLILGSLLKYISLHTIYIRLPSSLEENYIIIIIYSYPTALDMVASGKVNVKPLITHTYKLEETIQAFQRSKTGEGGAIKVCVSNRIYHRAPKMDSPCNCE